jgi:putative membrane protein
MTQHELLMVVAAPLIILGRPWIALLWAMPERLRHRTLQWWQTLHLDSAWRRATGPIVVLILHAVVLWVWHIPTLFQAALRNEAVHAFQHFGFFVTAAMFWFALIHGRYGRVGYGLAVFFVFATAMHTSILGALLTFASRLWYPIYGPRGAALKVDAIDDQRLAGLIMWIPAGVLLTIIALALFAAWLGESERRVRIAEGKEA